MKLLGSRGCFGLLAIAWFTTLGCSSLSAQAEDAGERRATSRETLSTLGVIGASQTAGFGAGVSMGKVLQAGLNFPTRLVETASVMFFMKPLAVGEEQIQFLRRQRPTAIIGLDYLFWFGYGDKDFDTRKAHLQQAFTWLESLPGPKFIGDIPDMRGAAEYMLPTRFVPPVEQIDQLNEMIVQWAKVRPDVTLIPLSRLVRSMRSGQPAEIGGREYAADPKKVLGSDRLHATLDGQLLLGIACLAAFRERLPGLLDADVMTDLTQLGEAVERRRLGLPAPEDAKPQPVPPTEESGKEESAGPKRSRR